MSWIADLAGKAESLLNNIDQSAAGAIQVNPEINKKTEFQGGVSELPKIQENKNISQQEQSHIAVEPTSQQRLSTNIPLTSQGKPSEFTPKKKKNDKEEALFDFLNSTSKLPPTKSKISNENIRSKSAVAHSIKSSSSSSSLSSLHFKQQNLPTDLQISRKLSIDSNKHSLNEQNSTSSEAESNVIQNDSTASESEFEMISTVVSAAPSEHGSDDLDSKRINLQTENQLLRDEIGALHQEMRSLSERNKRTKEELHKKKTEFKAHIDDVENELHVKKSQNSALQIELQRMTEEGEQYQNEIKSLREQKNRILEDQTAGSGMHVQAMEALHKRLNDAEEQIIKEKEKYEQTQHDFLAMQSGLNDDMQKLATSLKQSQNECMSEKKRINSLSTELNSAKTNLSLAMQELNDYKVKATRILQSKEKIIASLRDGPEAQDQSFSVSQIELEELHQDRDTMKEELHTTRSELFHTRNKLQEIESQHQQDMSLLQEDYDEAKQHIKDSDATRREVEDEINKLRMEIQGYKESASQYRTNFNEKLHNKEAEIGRLQNQLMMRSMSTPDESELESRLKQLTESLIQKQTLVEGLSSEKSSLVLQLERTEGQLIRLTKENSHQTKITVDHGYQQSNSDNAHGYIGPEHGMVGRFRIAASAVDKFSVRLGVFLRRYPIARLFVIVYMGILHLWVMIVLLTYSPEIHDHDYSPIKKDHMPDNNGLPNE